jgi:hypothetical protein
MPADEPNPEPDVESHPHGYSWSKRFPDAWMLLGGEGEAVYAAKGEDAYWVIRDSGTMADFLDEEDADLARVTLERYSSHEAWERACKQWASRLVPHHIRQAVTDALAPLATACSDLANERDLSWLNERDHFKPVVKKVLPDYIPHRAEVTMRETELGVACPPWPALGGVDIAVEGKGRLPVAIELKAGSDKHALGACGWDTVKLGFLADRETVVAGFLVAITTASLWKQPVRGAELFDYGNHRAEKLRRDFATYFKKYEQDGYPVADCVPTAYETIPVGSASLAVAGEAWEVRAAQVLVTDPTPYRWQRLIKL